MRSFSGVALAASCTLFVAPGCKKPPPAPPRAAVPVSAPAAAGPIAPGSAAPGAPTPAPVAPPAPVSERPAVLGELPDPTPARFHGRSGATPTAPVVAPAPGTELVFAELGGGVAFVAVQGGKFRVVHNGRPGEEYEEVQDVVLSRDGARCAYGARAHGQWHLVVDGVAGPPRASLEAPVFSPDGAHVAHRASDGERWRLVVDGKASAPAATRYESPMFAADSSRIVYFDAVDETGHGRLVVSDLGFERPALLEPRAKTLLASPDHAHFATVAEREGREVAVAVDLSGPTPAITRGQPQDSVMYLAIGPRGEVAYSAQRDGERYFVLDGREERLLPGVQVTTFPVIRPDGRSAAAALIVGDAVVLRQFFASDAAAPLSYSGIDGLVFSPDGCHFAFAVELPDRNFVVVDGKEGPPFDRVVTPVFSPDGRSVAYRARKDGQRFVVVADGNGQTMRQLSPHEQVFPVRFTADGKKLAYGVKDGRQLAWKVETL
jgi:hypothetical protein